MTNRERMNSMSDADMGKWLFALMGGISSKLCPVEAVFCRKRRKHEGPAYPCSDIIADWLRADAE